MSGGISSLSSHPSAPNLYPIQPTTYYSTSPLPVPSPPSENHPYLSLSGSNDNTGTSKDMLFPRVRTPGIRLRTTHLHTQHWNHTYPTLYTNTASFSTSPIRRATSREPSHYEILEVPITASPAEIKKCEYPSTLTVFLASDIYTYT